MNKQASHFTLQDVAAAVRFRFPRWLILFVAAGALVLAVCYFAKDRATVSAEINFSYDGIESGLDPAGNRFDEEEIKSAEMIRQAAAAVGLSLEEIETMQNAIEIQGNVPNFIFGSIIENASIYGNDAIETVETVRETAYFPSRYTVTLHYAEAGCSAKQGTRFLQELLSAYEGFFYERYGYNRSLENSLTSLDYAEYDYINAVDVLSDRLTSLRAYLAALASQDNTRFVSSQTGYSFSDLIDAIDTIQDEDINWVTSYIVSNNITKDRQDLIDYYLYRIEDAERELAQRQSRLYTLNTQIEGYVKTVAVFLADTESDSSEQGSTGYEFTQQSRMYDNLINERVSCETAISGIQEQIALYQQRAERLRSDSATGNPALVEMNLDRVDGKVTRFLEDTRETADEFFRTVALKRAFQVLREPKNTGASVTGLLREAFPAALIVEAVLFGVFVLRIPANVRSEARKKSAAMETAGRGSVPAQEEEPVEEPISETREAVTK